MGTIDGLMMQGPAFGQDSISCRLCQPCSEWHDRCLSVHHSSYRTGPEQLSAPPHPPIDSEQRFESISEALMQKLGTLHAGFMRIS